MCTVPLLSHAPLHLCRARTIGKLHSSQPTGAGEGVMSSVSVWCEIVVCVCVRVCCLDETHRAPCGDFFGAEHNTVCSLANLPFDEVVLHPC
jgi:hypothetical protein